MTEHLSNGQFAKKEVSSEVDSQKTPGKHLWQKGRAKTGGRKKGTPNKTTRAVKDFLLALVNDVDTQEAVQERIRKGDAVAFFRALEHVVGKPKETIDANVTAEFRWAGGNRG